MVSANSNHLELSSDVLKGVSNDVAEDRDRKGIAVSRRIRWAPLPRQTKASLIACLVGPTAMYGFPAGGCTPMPINSLRTAVVAALWGTKRRSRCHEIVLTLFAKGHLVDPLQNAAYQSLRQLRRIAEQGPEPSLNSNVSGTAMRMVERCVMDQWQ